ncbi:ABC transporter permease [bacterium]|nr:ABC transporter permease [bacterium]
MKFIYFLTKKYLLSIFTDKTLRLPALISIISIFISVFSLLVVMFVMKGFEIKVQNKILENFPHIILSNNAKNNFDSIGNIISYSNSLEGYGAYINGNKFELIKLKAKANINTDSDIDDKNIYYGDISKDFLLLNNLVKNDDFEIYIPSPNTLKKIKKIKIKVSDAIDSSESIPIIYFSYNQAKNIIFSKEFIELKLHDPFKSKETINSIINKNNHLKGQIVDWQTINNNLFNIMKLERVSLGIFLSFLVLIASTTIYSNTTSMIFQRKSEIATLLILGAKKNYILAVFVLVSFLLSFIGYFFGVILAKISTNLLASQEIIDVLDINLTFYGIEGFPIIFSYSYFIIISLFTFFMILVASFFPTSFYLNKNVDELIMRDGK